MQSSYILGTLSAISKYANTIVSVFPAKREAVGATTLIAWVRKLGMKLTLGDNVMSASNDAANAKCSDTQQRYNQS